MSFSQGLADRKLVRLAGSRPWSAALAERLISEYQGLKGESLKATDVIYFGQHHHADLTPLQSKHAVDKNVKKYRSLLGQESDLLIFDAYEDFDANAFGALTGMIRAGGLCLLVTPTDEDWLQPDAQNRYLNQWLYYQCQQLPKLITHTEPEFENEGLPECLKHWLMEFVHYSNKAVPIPSADDFSLVNICKTQEQYQAVQAIMALMSKDSVNDISHRQCVLLQADRGRGKSAALGLAIGLLLSKRQPSKRLMQIGSAPESVSVTNKITVLLSAPNINAVQQVFAQAESLLSQQSIAFEKLSDHQLNTAVGQLQFIAPDQLSINTPKADLLVVDEAAAIPSHLLLSSFKKYQQLVMATTVHGYEGTGRGFEYKLKPQLREYYSQPSSDFQQINMVEPIRWRIDDGLEESVNQLLCLSTELPTCTFNNKKSQVIKYWPAAELVRQPHKLTTLFSMLVYAHYQTSPRDFMMLLSDCNFRLYSLEQDESSLAVVLVVKEGHLTSDLSDQIWQGRRRPKGDLLPQSLLAHAGFKQAGEFSYGRIVRIAVHPQIQKQGLGSEVLGQLKQILSSEYDFLATSFGATEALIRFWYANGFAPVRLGLKADASTGEVSMMMMQPLNTNAKSFLQQVQHRFQQSLWLEQQLPVRPQHTQMLCEKVYSLCGLDAEFESDLTAQDKLDILCFTEHFRTLDSCLLSLFKLLKLIEAKDKRVFEACNKLREKCLNGKTNKQIILAYHLTGEKQLVRALRAEAKNAFHALFHSL